MEAFITALAQKLGRIPTQQEISVAMRQGIGAMDTGGSMLKDVKARMGQTGDVPPWATAGQSFDSAPAATGVTPLPSRAMPDPGLTSPPASAVAPPPSNGSNWKTAAGVGGAGLAAALAILGLTEDDVGVASAPTGGPMQAGVRNQFGENALGPYSALDGGRAINDPLAPTGKLQTKMAAKKMKGPGAGPQVKGKPEQPPAKAEVPKMQDVDFSEGPYSMRSGNR